MKIIKSIFLLTSLISLSGCYETESGRIKGTINLVTREGIFFKTYNCEVVKGGLEDGTGNIGKTMEFNIEKKYLVHKANALLKDRKNITIQYHKEAICAPWRGDMRAYFIDDIIE